MDKSPAVTTTDIVPPGRRRRRGRRAGAVAALALLALVALAACTPSGYKAERYAVQSHTLNKTGQYVDIADVTCNEFTSPSSNSYEGICSAGSESWAVHSDYNEDHTSALITIEKWGGAMSGTCEARKSDGWAPLC